MKVKEFTLSGWEFGKGGPLFFKESQTFVRLVILKMKQYAILGKVDDHFKHVHINLICSNYSDNLIMKMDLL
jgi:hypothetical protein